MQKNPSAVGALPRTPLGELTALKKPLAGGIWRGLAAPSENPTPYLPFGPRPSALASHVPHSKISSDAAEPQNRVTAGENNLSKQTVPTTRKPLLTK